MDKKRGFTILEAMIAVTILAIGLLALMRVLPVGTRASKLAEQTTLAAMFAQEKLEDLRESTLTSFPPSNAEGTFAEEGYPNFGYDIAVFDYVSPTSTIRGVTISIYWPADADVEEQRHLLFTTALSDHRE
jgi:prepilin-type N-terminal cleavage/methylation domain-containing protein